MTTRVTIKKSGRTETHWFTYAFKARTWLLLNDYLQEDDDTYTHISGRGIATMKVRKLHHQA